MAKCVIIGPLYDGCERERIRKEPGDRVICADGGYAAAERYGIPVDLVIGDFDSAPAGMNPTCEVKRLPVHKDDTDLVVCLREGFNAGYRDFVILGTLGGRLDHTLAALQAAAGICAAGAKVLLADAKNRVRVLMPGMYDLSGECEESRFLSLIAASDRVTGICLTGTEWELENAELTMTFPLGVSNEVRGKPFLSFETGMLYVLYSRD